MRLYTDVVHIAKYTPAIWQHYSSVPRYISLGIYTSESSGKSSS